MKKRTDVQERRRITLKRFRDVLAKHGIIFPEAIDDPEAFDGGQTVRATQDAYKELWGLK